MLTLFVVNKVQISNLRMESGSVGNNVINHSGKFHYAKAMFKSLVRSTRIDEVA